jgi:hypothetical protein
MHVQAAAETAAAAHRGGGGLGGRGGGFGGGGGGDGGTTHVSIMAPVPHNPPASFKLPITNSEASQVS